MSDLRAVIVDDERLAREQLRRMLARCSGVLVVGEAEDPRGAVERVRHLEPDVVFLDINLAGESAFEILEHIDASVRIVFVTAYDEYAIRAFEVNACDYLLKPVRKQRLETALRRLRDRSDRDPSDRDPSDRDRPRPAPEVTPLAPDDYVLLTTGHHSSFLKVKNIARIESEAPYSRVYARDGKKSLVLKSLKQWQQRLPGTAFVRIHRSTIVNVDCVDRIEGSANHRFQVFLRHFDRPLIKSSSSCSRVGPSVSAARYNSCAWPTSS